MIIDHINNWRGYSLGPLWERAFEFLETLDADSEEKRYDLEGESLFAIVTSYPTKREDDASAVLESHREYADIHLTLRGAERFGMYPTHTLEVKTGYDAKKDAEFYTYESPSNVQVTLRPENFALYLPQDAHMPQLTAGESGDVVKKVVVKLKLDRLSL